MNIAALINWSKREFHHLPWRKNRSLYGTLVSEIMLQQTTVATVRNKFESFLKRFPDIQTLAKASEEEVCMEWKGLGYYRRARLLRQAAIALVQECGGEFPSERHELKKLSGIGDYTASAIVAIGHDLDEIAIDANIERVISRLYGLGEFKGPHLHKAVRELFENGELIPKGVSARDYNEALMDLGRVYCQARKAECVMCPLSGECVAQASGEAIAFPREKDSEQVKEKHHAILIRVLDYNQTSIKGIERLPHEWLAGQIELPTFVLESSDKNFDRYPQWTGKLPDEVMRIKSTITKYRFENIVVHSKISKMHDYKLDAEAVNFSSVTLKILRKLSLV